MAIVDEIFNKKNGGQFFSGKKDQTWGGGSEGSLVKDHTFAAFFFVHPSLIVQKHLSQLVQRQSEEADNDICGATY